jgi:hypothetical protein
MKLLFYALSVLFPAVGTILGIVFLVRPDPESKRLGLICLVISLIVTAIWTVLGCVFAPFFIGLFSGYEVHVLSPFISAG